MEYWQSVLGVEKAAEVPAMWHAAAEPAAPAVVPGGYTDPWQDKQDKDHCERLLDKVFTGSRNVKFLIEELHMLGASMDRGRVKCVDATQATTLSGQGGYLWKDVPEAGLVRGDIVLAQRENQSYHAVATSLRHELLHAFDDARAKVDPTNCLHHACSEIRAARLSGECALGNEMLRGRSLATGDGTNLSQGEQCVKRRATLSVSHNPSCARMAQHAASTVWEQCIKDNAPYHKFPLDVVFAD
eukprot:TRINITY_DN18244_c0_g2_i1.p1 TRINITY_DN18244_c0_g2~~TRINITY_DN18244_c0_g2_i1.p1  ORF type:complete len:243 (+),score=83.12 TRINITY_DN18244_c0_g2_i1:73-801(+)